MPTPEELQAQAEVNEFIKVLADAHGATLVDSQTNANMLSSFLLANGQQLTAQNMLAAVLGPLRHAIQWFTPPSEVDDLPPVPPYMEFLKSKADIATITADGRFMKWMKSKHKNQLSERINFVLRHNLTKTE